MIGYALLVPEQRLILAGILFLTALGELALALYRFVCSHKWKYSVLPIVIYICLLIFLSVAIGTPVTEEAVAYRMMVPWIFFPILSVIVMAHSFVLLLREYQKSKQQITPNSVKEAIDRLDCGICFADESNRLILINHRMNQLAFQVIGSYPQTLSEIRLALEQSEETDGARDGVKDGVRRISKDPLLYRFPNGRIWKFQVDLLEAPGLEGYQQMTAQDMTELHQVNVELEKDNKAIGESIHKMQEMILRMSDLAREQETLNLKMQIHNDIGASLISLSGLTNGENEKDAQTQVATLKKALAYFSSRPSMEREGGDEGENEENLAGFAEKCGVALKFEGNLPEHEGIKNLIDCAVRECITNCVRHAKGRFVNVRLTEEGNRFCCTITNDGDLPDTPVIEGGGLSSLRKKVEEAGGQMEIGCIPGFTLTLSFMKNERQR